MSESTKITIEIDNSINIDDMVALLHQLGYRVNKVSYKFPDTINSEFSEQVTMVGPKSNAEIFNPDKTPKPN